MWVCEGVRGGMDVVDRLWVCEGVRGGMDVVDRLCGYVRV